MGFVKSDLSRELNIDQQHGKRDEKDRQGLEDNFEVKVFERHR